MSGFAPSAAGAAAASPSDRARGSLREEVPGLRERKAAATREALCNALLASLERKAIAEITVEEIAEAANVSRMTFFNYFPTKEHAGWHLVARWMFQLAARLALGDLRGLPALLEVGDVFVESFAAGDTAMKKLFAYLATAPLEKHPVTLSLAERQALAPELASHDLEWASLGRILARHVAEARRAGEIDVEGTDFEVAHYLGAVLNGACIMTHTVPDVDHRALLRRHVRRALGVGFGPLEGRRATAPPRTPARYRIADQKPKRKKT